MIPIKLYIGLFLGVGVMCFLFAAVAGQPSGMLMGLFFMGWGAVAWYLKYGRAVAAKNRGASQVSGGREDAQKTASVNTALQSLKQDRTYDYTDRMVKAIPELARQLMLSARERSMKLQNAPSWYAECVLDFELTGAFHRALAFCKDPALASLFVDALLFEATGQEPTAPEDLDVMSSLTHLYRGLGKYVIAKTSLRVSPSEVPLWVFGMEYAAATGSPLDPNRVTEIRLSAIEIRESAFSRTSSTLVRGVVVPGAEYVKPNSFPGADYLIRPGMCRPSKFKDQPKESYERGCQEKNSPLLPFKGEAV
jgi:hypothetical protein